MWVPQVRGPPVRCFLCSFPPLSCFPNTSPRLGGCTVIEVTLGRDTQTLGRCFQTLVSVLRAIIAPLAPQNTFRKNWGCSKKMPLIFFQRIILEKTLLSSLSKSTMTTCNKKVWKCRSVAVPHPGCKRRSGQGESLGRAMSSCQSSLLSVRLTLGCSSADCCPGAFGKQPKECFSWKRKCWFVLPQLSASCLLLFFTGTGLNPKNGF